MKPFPKPLSFVALLLATTPVLAPGLLPGFAAQAQEAQHREEDEQQEGARKPAPVFPPIHKTAFHTPTFDLALRADTQTLAHLSPTGDEAFDFVPAAREAERAGDGYVHIGDIHVRLRAAGGDWQDFSSAHARQQIAALPGGQACSPQPTSPPR
jgi:hypothetical protein